MRLGTPHSTAIYHGWSMERSLCAVRPVTPRATSQRQPTRGPPKRPDENIFRHLAPRTELASRLCLNAHSCILLCCHVNVPGHRYRHQKPRCSLAKTSGRTFHFGSVPWPGLLTVTLS